MSVWRILATNECTWNCGLDTHLASWENNGCCILTNCWGSTTSKISSTSPKNHTSFALFVLGQNLSRPSITCCTKGEGHHVSANGGVVMGWALTCSVNSGSFSRNWTTQYANYTENHNNSNNDIHIINYFNKQKQVNKQNSACNEPNVPKGSKISWAAAGTNSIIIIIAKGEGTIIINSIATSQLTDWPVLDIELMI